MKNVFAIILMLGLLININAQFTVAVDTTVKYQVFKGFGAAHSISVNFTEKSLRQEFDNFGRVNVRFGVMSDSNFITSKAELDAGIYDFTKSELYKPALYLKETKKWGLNRTVIEIFSPPGWMKSGGKSLCFPCPDSMNYLLPAHYNDFAIWAGILVKEMIKVAGDLDFCLSIQNEPRFNEEWPKCIYDPGRYADVIKVVGAYFQTNDTLKNVFLFGPTDMGLWGTQRPWMDTLLTARPDAGAYLKGWGNQGYMDGVNPNIGDSSGWTAFAKKIIDENNKELWMSSGDCSAALTYPDAFNVAKHIHFALKDGRVSCFHYWGITMFFDGAWLGMRGQLAKQYYRFIPPGHRQFSMNESEKDFLAMGFKNNKNITICFLNDDAVNDKTFQLDQTLAPFFHAYSMDKNEQMCVYKGRIRNNSFTVKSKGMLTLYYNDTDSDAIYAPVPPVVNATAITDNSVTLNWTPSSKWTMKGVSKSYDVQVLPGYKVIKNYLYANGKSVTDTTYTYTGLTPCTQYTFTVSIMDSLNNTAFSSVKVTTTGTNCPEAIAEETGPAVLIYPNPASEKITVDVADEMTGCKIEIIDRVGNIMISRTLLAKELDISGLPEGFYLVKIISDKKIITGRFVKQ